MYTLVLEKAPPEECSFTFEVGEHVIGRGPILQCTSKKVSRNHALLKVTPSDGVFLESTHNNPCYHKSSNTQSIQIIPFTKSIKLNNNDKIALALEHGWLTVKITKSVDATNNNSTNTGSNAVAPLDFSKSNKRELDNTTDNDGSSEAKKSKLNDQTDVTDNIENDESSPLVLAEIVDNNQSPEIENEMQVDNNQTSEIENEIQADNISIKIEPLNETEVPATSTESVSEIKDEFVAMDEIDVKEEPIDTSPEKEIKEEPEKKDKCTNSDGSNNPSTSGGDSASSSRRDRCWYGSSCYRKNPMHRASFSHPTDADYDSDPNDSRPVCCYGMNCYRRNRLHREKYRHPGQKKIPDPPNKKQSNQPKPPNATTDTRKRKVKTNAVRSNDFDDDNEDDYDLDDPFINDCDSSDEYEPESSDTESDYEESSQSQNTDEDTKQLLKDARKFQRRK